MTSIFWANFFLGFINLITFVIGLLLAEYEFARQTNPEVIFIQTPVIFDTITSLLLIVISLLNLAVLVFVIRRQLGHHRRWLWWTTAALIGLTLVLVLILGDRTRFVLWPNSI